MARVVEEVARNGAPRNFPMQGYLFGDSQLGVSSFETGLKPERYELLCNHPLLERGKRYKLLDGRVIEISGILCEPAPEKREPPGPSWDHSYWVVGWDGDPIPEEELLRMLESSQPVRRESEGRCQKTGRQPRQARR